MQWQPRPFFFFSWPRGDTSLPASHLIGHSCIGKKKRKKKTNLHYVLPCKKNLSDDSLALVPKQRQRPSQPSPPPPTPPYPTYPAWAKACPGKVWWKLKLSEDGDAVLSNANTCLQGDFENKNGIQTPGIHRRLEQDASSLSKKNSYIFGDNIPAWKRRQKLAALKGTMLDLHKVLNQPIDFLDTNLATCVFYKICWLDIFTRNWRYGPQRKDQGRGRGKKSQSYHTDPDFEHNH